MSADPVEAEDLSFGHAYLSTACYHGQHEHCSSEVRDDGGSKIPARCKFCPAPCRCECGHEGVTR